MHDGGADLCSAYAGALLLAETGLLDGMASTTHWAFAPTFRRNFPTIDLTSTSCWSSPARVASS